MPLGDEFVTVMIHRSTRVRLKWLSALSGLPMYVLIETLLRAHGPALVPDEVWANGPQPEEMPHGRSA